MVSSTEPSVDLLEEALAAAYRTGYKKAVQDMLEHASSLLDDGGPTISIVRPLEQWPVMNGLHLSFRGKEMGFKGERYAQILRILLDARGQVVSQAEMRSAYGGGKHALHPAICNIRKMLGEYLPDIQIETFGGGYRLVVTPE